VSSPSSERPSKGLQFRPDLALYAVLLMAAVFLTPILKTPLLGDDAFNSYLTGYMKYNGMSELELMKIYDGRLIAEQGRYIPGLTIVEFAMWTLTQSAVTIKIVQVCAILFDLALFFVFLRKLSGLRSLALWSTAIVLTTFEIRDFYDPYAGIVVVMQLVLAILLGAFILTLDAIDGPRKPWHIPAAVALYAAACLTYEIAYLYVAVVFVIAWFRLAAFRKALRFTLPFLGVLAVVVVKDLWLRHAALTLNAVAAAPHGLPVQSREYVVAFNPLANLQTWFWQTAGAVPLTYIRLDPAHYFPPLPAILMRPSPVAAVLVLVTLVAGFALLRAAPAERELPRKNGFAQFAAIGVLFAVVPGFLISLSPRWQAEVIPGQAYLPVYEAGFGIAMILATIVVAILERAGRLRIVAGLTFPIALAFVLLLTYQANAITLAIYDPTWNWARENLTQSLRLGLVASVPDESAVFLDTSYPFFYANSFIWETRNLIDLYADKRVVAYAPGDIAPSSALCTGQRTGCVPATPAYQLFNVATSYTDGFDSLVKIDRIRYDGTSGVALGHQATIVERGTAFGPRPVAAARSLADRDFTLEAVGSNWRRFHVATACGPVSANVFANADLIDLVYGTGFYGQERSAAETWRWAQNAATLTIANSLGARQVVRFDFTAEALDPRPSTLTVRYAGKTIVRPLSGKPLRLALRADLGPLQRLAVQFSTDAPKPSAIPDPRDLHFRIVDPHATALTTPAGC